jgi:hypothetical protein
MQTLFAIKEIIRVSKFRKTRTIFSAFLSLGFAGKQPLLLRAPESKVEKGKREEVTEAITITLIIQVNQHISRKMPRETRTRKVFLSQAQTIKIFLWQFFRKQRAKQ